ncbi:UDP-N-acetylglucosamine 1-carboxyvinyltransferase [Chthonomonas calidirosea]|uniref:UDP-N-acetylglucosamine 1-carboxyvinyltransferase n=1 Tax=Chthonomonas calidirosea TaxID=454171 RepID=UPI0006EC7407|nr:UDP-N-acetylglucosamine 1-carboxyvinyltransferase [Chthonomonas calidirosea]CEK17163.1 UDP-N-acetylglucosamine 1-carboxyvinyltransferase [Chthonomonas calidirosea]
MEKLVIRGGSPLSGEVYIGGSKNDALAIIPAALLVPGKTRLRNVPRITDVDKMLEILRHLGAKADFLPDNTLEIDATQLTTSQAPHELVRQMRASFNLLGVLLTRFQEAAVAMPGGCNIGARPVNFHIKGLEQLGARLNLEHGIYVGTCRRLVGTNLYLEFPSAGATQHLMMAACCAQGRTVIQNCAQEPEVVNLAEFLNACGAKISGMGTSTIVIEGVDRLYPTEFSIIPDRLQAGTYAIAAAATGGDVYIRNAVPDHCRAVLNKLMEAGAEVTPIDGGMRVRRVGKIHPTDIKTMPHPGFPTDMQQPFVALLTIADGVSVITETVYESRFRYTTELQRMGADIRVEGPTAIVTGVPQLNGAPVSCTDLRGGAALVIAGLVAQGVTVVSELEHLDRGYENLVENLRGLGADIARVPEEQARSYESV